MGLDTPILTINSNERYKMFMVSAVSLQQYL